MKAVRLPRGLPLVVVGILLMGVSVAWLVIQVLHNGR